MQASSPSRRKSKHQPKGSYRFKLNDHDVTFATWEEWNFAELLEKNGVIWEYEPLRFALLTHDDGQPRLGFQPDFYLPGHHLLVELTRAENKLERKLDQIGYMRRLHPEYRIALLGPTQLSSIFQRDGDRVFGPGELIDWLLGLHWQWVDAHARAWAGARQLGWLAVGYDPA
jgi:hypothetical protein